MNRIIEARKDEVEAINAIIERKNQDVMDSIYYARRIQEAVLPEKASLGTFAKKIFVYYQPKDVVSGDFYWWSYRNNRYIMAVADCTGHGVPGAFMSLIASNFLNQAVNEFEIVEPDAILTYVDKQMRKTLKQDQSGANRPKDGMDVGVISIDIQSNVLTFAAARRPLYFVRSGHLEEIQGARLSIGDFIDETESSPYVNYTIETKPGDSFYLFTDGITDQFGGEKFRKYTPARLRSFITELRFVPFNQQEEALRKELNEWRGDKIQTDDILLLGVRL